MEIADEFFGDAVVVGTGVFRVRTTRSGYLGAERDIILIRAVITVVLTVTNLPGENTASIVALKAITADALIPAITLLFKNYIFMLKQQKTIAFVFKGLPLRQNCLHNRQHRCTDPLRRHRHD